MHITCRAPVLSATSSTVCIWIIAFSNLTRRGTAHWRWPVLEPVRVKSSPPEPAYRSLADIDDWRTEHFGRISAFAQGLASRLDHLRLFDQALDAPCLGLGELAASLDLDQVAFLVFILLVMRVVLLRARDDLAIDGMRHPAL